MHNIKGDQNNNASYLSAVGEHPDSNETVISYEDKIEAIKAVGLQVDSAKKRLKEQEFKELVYLLYEYKHLFITDDADIPLSNLPSVKVPLLDDKPVRIKPYRLPPLMDAELNRQVSKLCQAGVMEPTTSLYSSPIFLVPGTPGNTGIAWRAVTDFRSINLRIYPENHALPRVEDCMHKIGQSKATLYSIFDNKGAFYCLPLADWRRRAGTSHLQHLQISRSLYTHASRHYDRISSLSA
jgi:hypothetical protein